MNTHADKKNKSKSVTSAFSQKQSGSESTLQFVDNRPEAVAQLKLQEMANNSQQVSQQGAFQEIADNHTAQQQEPIQKKENNTGLPDNLKTGMENLSGMSLDDVKVHHNSDKPAQLQAHAYAQGSDIHLAPGQEKHLPHEAWHVVQQKQDRVKPTLQMKGKVNVNDDVGLEKEADVMGNKAQVEGQLNTPEKQLETAVSSNNLIQGMFSSNQYVYQFAGGGEGGGSWFPAAVALGMGLFLVYRSSDGNNQNSHSDSDSDSNSDSDSDSDSDYDEEISSKEAQNRQLVSSDGVKRDSEALKAIPTDEKFEEEDNAAKATSAPSESHQSTETAIGPDFLRPVEAISSLSASGDFNKMSKAAAADNTVESGSGETLYSSTSLGSSGYSRSQLTGPGVKQDQNGNVSTSMLQYDNQIRTQNSSTHTQGKLGNMSMTRTDDSINMHTSMGEASVSYNGQHTRGKASVEGANTGLQFDENGAGVYGSTGKAAVEGSATVKGERWATTVGGKAEWEGPNFKVGTGGVDLSGANTSTTGGVSFSRRRDENDPTSSKQIAYIMRKAGEFPEGDINTEEIYQIVREKLGIEESDNEEVAPNEEAESQSSISKFFGSFFSDDNSSFSNDRNDSDSDSGSDSDSDTEDEYDDHNSDEMEDVVADYKEQLEVIRDYDPSAKEDIAIAEKNLEDAMEAKSRK